ncbi:hypothetical protein [Sporosarcina sp. FSL K6-1508]|uniref:hypothetical protein n=1 Tax=Sporosarcina sp. FSL K6-1508 TaxID=2921553 RepID=UPI0030F74824
MSFFKTMFVRKSSVLKGPFLIGHDRDKIEQMIDILIREIDQKEDLTKKRVADFNELDLEVMMAHITAKSEWMKAIQFAIACIAILFVSLTGFFRVIDGDVIKVYILIGFTAIISLTCIEFTWRNRLMNYAYLKELLLIYKNEKFKVK